MKDYNELIAELRSEAEKTWEYDRDAWTSDEYEKAADAIEQLVTERDAAIAELKMLEKHIGKSIPKRCKTCELWGKRGWSQFEVGYCEGDDNPHSPNDFCSRWRGVQA
ncbi:MAG: hypothetical protein KBT06_08630 [Prevotellaceae bacterium]|nr:hypothetical protein [Candidatus Colivivens equi]